MNSKPSFPIPGNAPRAVAPTAAALLLGALALVPAAAQGQGASDNFDDGNDTGWTRYEPLAGFGAGGTYAFPGGAYGIGAGGSPAPGLVGPGRAGSFRLDASLSDFTLTFDLVDWGTTPFFAGGFARIKDPGLASTDGYALGFDFSVNRLFISLVTDEAVAKVVVVSEPLTLDPAKDYRLRFDAIGSDFSGRIDELGGSTPLATIFGSDATYSSGAVGLGVVVQSSTAGVGANATFDNFVAVVPEPSGTTLLVVGAGALLGGSARRRRR